MRGNLVRPSLPRSRFSRSHQAESEARGMSKRKRITILALFLPERGRHPRLRQRKLIESLACAARWFNADLHVLFSHAIHESAQAELSRLREHPLRAGISIIEHLSGEDLVQPFIDLAQEVSADYLCFEDGGL